MKLAVFSDFDGTACRRDVGYHLSKTFSNGQSDELVAMWMSGEVSTRECLNREAELMTLPKEDLEDYLKQFELNQGFIEFAQLCKNQNIDITILSDGFGFYIYDILKRNGLDWLDVITNDGQISGEKLTMFYPHDNLICQRCGSCKGERIDEYLKAQNDDVTVIFVGDGLSDVCALEKSNIIFAKKDLKQYCLQNNIAHIVYDDFWDIIGHLQKQGLLKH